MPEDELEAGLDADTGRAEQRKPIRVRQQELEALGPSDRGYREVVSDLIEAAKVLLKAEGAVRSRASCGPTGTSSEPGPARSCAWGEVPQIAGDGQLSTALDHELATGNQFGAR